MSGEPIDAPPGAGSDVSDPRLPRPGLPRGSASAPPPLVTAPHRTVPDGGAGYRERGPRLAAPGTVDYPGKALRPGAARDRSRGLGGHASRQCRTLA
jgi:hypothetical protein